LREREREREKRLWEAKEEEGRISRVRA